MELHVGNDAAWQTVFYTGSPSLLYRERGNLKLNFQNDAALNLSKGILARIIVRRSRPIYDLGQSEIIVSSQLQKRNENKRLFAEKYYCMVERRKN